MNENKRLRGDGRNLFDDLRLLCLQDSITKIFSLASITLPEIIMIAWFIYI